MKVCKSCKVEKLESEFYHWRAVCKPCFDKSELITTKCSECGIERVVTKTSVRLTSGKCRYCAQKIAKNTPEERKRLSIVARKQVIKQGGIPNAIKFTSEKTKGERHHNWKGGKTDPIQRIRGTAEYNKWRDDIYKRDEYTCQECGAKDKQLHAHHIKPFKQFPELRFDINNGQTLCASCHHRHEAQFIKCFQKRVHN